MLQAPDVTLKMSTALEGPLSAAQRMRLAHAISKPTSAHSSIPLPNPHNTTRKVTKINMATRTIATSEDRDSEVRQRCGCKISSSYAEICSAPSSRRHVADVNSVGEASDHCARNKTFTHNQQNPTSAHSTIPFPNPHNTTRKVTKINMATRTIATSKDRDSKVRQRCGCKIKSRYAESCSAPSSRRQVEDVHNVGGEVALR